MLITIVLEVGSQKNLFYSKVYKLQRLFLSGLRKEIEFLLISGLKRGGFKKYREPRILQKRQGLRTRSYFLRFRLR
jgi:hypothetical protein